jgi:hypothetical protein
LNVDCIYVYADLLGKKLSRGVMRRSKGKKHCRTSWFMEIFFLKILSILCALVLYVDLIK